MRAVHVRPPSNWRLASVGTSDINLIDRLLQTFKGPLLIDNIFSNFVFLYWFCINNLIMCLYSALKVTTIVSINNDVSVTRGKGLTGVVDYCCVPSLCISLRSILLKIV